MGRHSGYLPEGRRAEPGLFGGKEASLCGDDIVIKEGQILQVPDTDAGVMWLVHPFRFYVKHPGRLVIDWEHVEYQWIDPEDIKKYDCVPQLYETWRRVADG